MFWQIIDYKFKKVINSLPVQCQKKYAVFKHIAQASGLEGLRSSPGFKLELLKGKLAGLYSIRLNISYRVVFEVKHEIRIIDVVELSKHRYKP